MEKNTKTLIITVGVTLLLIIGTVSASFAFFTISKKQTQANIFNSGCLNISIENESNAITLNKTYPITDLEGLELTGYTFTIKNTCSTSTNYMINLESLNETTNTLNTNYIKTSLSSDTMDNLIQKLNSNMVTQSYIENAYISHNLYKGTISGNTTKEFNLKLWMDYDTTNEQGTNKTYTSKINVIANPDLEINSTPEVKTTLVNNTLEGTITGSASSAKYCISDNNICTPSSSTSINNNKVSVELNRSKDQIVCININDGKTTCSNKIDKLLPITVDDIIASSNAKSDVPNFSSIATGDEGVFQTTDGMYDNGTTYYWRGAVENNYVKFAGFCWRIVRINGDKTIRMIYDGSTCHANGTTGQTNTDSIAVTSQAYNPTSNASYYVGWTYISDKRPSETNNDGSVGDPVNAKTQTENWYNSHIGNNPTYASKVADGKYCNDRDVTAAPSGWSGYVTQWSATGTQFAYAGPKRLYENYSPTFNCPSGDVYTLKVGLITADEVEFAGGKNENNTSYYLYNGQYYWTMSPYRWDGGYASVFFVNSDGRLSGNRVHFTRGLRPVINLKADTEFASGGTGTQNNPYVVS